MRTCCICQLPFVRRGPRSYEKCVLVSSNYTSNLGRMSQHCFNMHDATCQLKNVEVKNSTIIVPDMLDHSMVSIYIQTNMAFIRIFKVKNSTNIPALIIGVQHCLMFLLNPSW